jgi:triosephosphate isomerase
MRKLIVAGNWKMNKTFDEAEELITVIASMMDEKEFKCDIIVCPPALYLEMATDVADVSELYVGAQNVSDQASGAYTGEISAAMLESVEVDYCIIGHSERRKYFNEQDEVLARKVNLLLEHGIQPIYCCGELLEEREKKTHFDVVRQQLINGLFHLPDEAFANVVIAYEPVWAIGTGVNATPDQAQEMHKFIRDLIADAYNNDQAQHTTILYGGSCNAKNAKDLFANEDVDGGLIGGASLKADEFIKIADSF